MAMLSGSGGHNEPSHATDASLAAPLGDAPRPASRRRQSIGDLPKPTEPPPSSGDTWLNEELSAVGELKRGAIAARFPEEFSVDSDFLNNSSNVWLPARLHPEIAPGEFQEWLKKHGSQLSKIEDSVHRRKSILSYSYKDAEAAMQADGGDQQRASAAVGGVARRNTTGLVRRKTFVERVDEEVKAEGDEGFLVQGLQRSSLKRSKLANKRRDSTASQPGRRRRTATDSSVPGVSSPLAPMQPVQQSADPASAPVPAARPESTLLPSDSTNLLVSQTSGNDNKTQPHDLSGGVPPSSSTTSTLAQQRLSTAEILKQVTAAVDGLGFDDYEVCDADMAAPEPSAASAGTLAAGVVTRDAPGDAAQAPKTVVHKKSASWWQWGAREDSVQVESEQQQQQQHQQQHQQQPVPVQVSGPKETVSKEQAETAGASRNKLPSPISFLRFNRKSKKERKGTEEPQRSASPQPPRQPQHPPQPPQQQSRQDADSASDASSDTSEPPPPPVAAPVAAAAGAGAKPGHSNIPSIITPVRPAPTARAGANSRLPIHIERAIYRLASIKLANPRRPLLQQVLLSNMMFWYLELINPRSQPAQVQQPITPNNHQQSQQQQQQQQQQQNHQHQQQNHHQQKQQHQQKQHQQQQQQKQHDAPASDRRGKRANNHKNSKDGSKGRRASGGTSSSERVVRTPQYERQQQQIYLNGGPPPQQHYVHVQSYGRHAVEQQEPDEDDDVPLALYRGERNNAMSIG